MPTPAKPKARIPSQKFGEAAVDLAITKWGSHAAALKALGYKPDSETLRRLKNGNGSDKSANALYEGLRREGVDVSKLPPIYPDEDASSREQTWRQEWLWIGEMLHDHAPPMYERAVDELRGLARELARRTGHELEIARAT